MLQEFFLSVLSIVLFPADSDTNYKNNKKKKKK